ncbi:MAG: hypothetical protein BGO95_02685 [Micrococcales bacterium 73-13]|nr:MAG: hypothetical protein BGO95_02685 [Micrococcales bacterium 73-13]
MAGSAERVAVEAARLDGVAEALASLAATLAGLADEDLAVGDGADAMRARASAVSACVHAVVPRYRTTADALREYAVELAEARALAAHAEADRAEAAAAGDAAAVDAAETRLRIAVDRWARAAELAAARIEAVLPDLDDGPGEHWSAFWTDVGTVLNGVGAVLAAALDAMITVTLLVGTALDAALALLLAAVAALADPIASTRLTGLLATDPGAALEALLGAALAALPATGPGLVLLLARERATPTPHVRERRPIGGVLRRRTPDELARRYGAAFDRVAALDRAGGHDRAVVEVVQLLGDDGTPRTDGSGHPLWRVTLPSTTDWQLDVAGALGDDGAPNDLGSNLALLLDPGAAPPYQRAVADAMRAAGIGPDDPVKLVGFSQGGILAARIASAVPPEFAVRAIQVGGAPIDRFPIPDRVSVISIRHDGDVVPRLDGASFRPHATAVALVAAPGGEPHSAATYAATARRLLDAPDRRQDSRLAAQLVVQDAFHSGLELVREYEFAEADHGLR